MLFPEFRSLKLLKFKLQYLELDSEFKFLIYFLWAIFSFFFKLKQTNKQTNQEGKDLNNYLVALNVPFN